MARCKVCGKPVRSANVFHPGCCEECYRQWERRMEHGDE